ncbi:MAG: branched-chain amino acid ABC transporter permease [Candidatus Dormiibacter spiritus]|nr:MAG: branched-chain amino acid ABC transporter permease [Candidatus Dormibacteraeota bacterium]
MAGMCAARPPGPGPRLAPAASQMSELPQLIVDGLVSGAVLAIAAVGVSLVYGILHLVNFAHGDYLTFGAYAGLGVTALGLSMVVATVVAVAATAALAVGLQLVLWGPVRRRRAGLLSSFITAIGLALVLRHAIFLVVGAGSRAYPVDQFSVERLGPVRVSISQLIAISLSIVAIAVIGVLLARTSIGRSMRAFADNPELAAVAGVDVGRIVLATWLVAGALAGLAGELQGLIQGAFDPNMGWNLLLPIFAAVVLGTIGNAYGALLGGFVLGLVMELSTWSVLGGGIPASYKYVVAFLALILMLLVRPQGLLGRRARAL